MASLKQLTLNHQAAMAQAAQREADLRVELETAQGKVRDFQKRVFGRKSEQRSHPEAVPGAPDPTPRSRGQQPGTPGVTDCRKRVKKCEIGVGSDKDGLAQKLGC